MKKLEIRRGDASILTIADVAGAARRRIVHIETVTQPLTNGQKTVPRASGSRLRVLQFAPRVCWPLDTGAKLRNYHLARVLADHATTELLAFSNEGQSSANLESIYEHVTTVRRDRSYTPSKILRGAIGTTPLPLLNYTTDAMKQELARVLDESDFDIMQMESIHLAAYSPIIRASRKRPIVVLDWHNIESDLMERYSERETNPLRRSYARKTARQIRTFEQRAIEEFDAHIAVSRGDAERLAKLNPKARIFVIENGVDIAFYSDEEIECAHATAHSSALDETAESRNKPISHRIIFVGSMDYHANIDAVVAFARDVWPGVHDRKPELVFTIVGRDPAPEVRELSSIPGIEITGTVDDVRPYYREALAAIVPLRVGGGSRLKILEAMAAGVPVVSTTLGAEGLTVEPGKDIVIADTNHELDEAIISMADNAKGRESLRIAGRLLVAERYDWSRLGVNLFEIYQGL